MAYSSQLNRSHTRHRWTDQLLLRRGHLVWQRQWNVPSLFLFFVFFLGEKWPDELKTGSYAAQWGLYSRVPIIQMADSIKKLFLIIVATTLCHLLSLSLCAITYWWVVQLADVWIVSFFPLCRISLPKLKPQTKWSIHLLFLRFIAVPAAPLLMRRLQSEGTLECQKLFFFPPFFFADPPSCPYMCCSASWACSVYTSSFPTNELKSRCAARCELRCLSREKKLNLWRQTEDRATVSSPDGNVRQEALRVLNVTVSWKSGNVEERILSEPTCLQQSAENNFFASRQIITACLWRKITNDNSLTL